MKKALIFGIGGFVGPYLAKELQENGYEIYGTDTIEKNGAFSYAGYFQCNILDKDNVERIIEEVKPSHIINLAAISSVGQSWKMPDITMQVNVNGTLNIFDSCLSIGIKPSILLIGSSEEYVVSDKPMDENTPINANNPYGISKIAQEQFAKIYREKYNWNIYCVRAFNHIGVGQRTSFVIPSWCKQVADIEKGLIEPIIRVGNINVARDFTDVKDIVRAYRLIIESKNSNVIFNVGQGKVILLSQILDYLISLSSKKISVEINQELIRPNDNKIICCNNERIKRLLNWFPKYDVFETIKEIYERSLSI